MKYLLCSVPKSIDLFLGLYDSEESAWVALEEIKTLCLEICKKAEPIDLEYLFKCQDIFESTHPNVKYTIKTAEGLHCYPYYNETTEEAKQYKEKILELSSDGTNETYIYEQLYHTLSVKEQYVYDIVFKRIYIPFYKGKKYWEKYFNAKFNSKFFRVVKIQDTVI